MKTSSGRRSGYCMKIGIVDSWLAGWLSRGGLGWLGCLGWDVWLSGCLAE